MGSTGYNGGNGRDPEAEPDSDNVVRLPLQDNRPPPRREPMINLPPATKFLVFALVLIHLGTQFLRPAMLDWVYTHFGFVGGVYTGHAPFTWTALVAPFTYMLLHANWLHVGMNSVMLAAFGSGIERDRSLGGKKMLILFVLCGLAAVTVQFVTSPFITEPVIGASGGVVGLFAAVLLLMQRDGTVATGRYGLWPLVIVWVIVEASLGSSGVGPGGGNIAWVAHIGGFLAGLVLLKPVIRLKIGR